MFFYLKQYLLLSMQFVVVVHKPLNCSSAKASPLVAILLQEN